MNDAELRHMVDLLRAEVAKLQEALVWAASDPSDLMGEPTPVLNAKIQDWTRSQPRHYADTLGEAQEAVRERGRLRPSF